MRRRSVGARVGIWVVQLILPISVLIALPAPVRKSLAPAGAAVLEKINREGRATYWVVLKEQADLSGAFRIADWAARGQYVYDALTSVAARSQVGVASHLKTRALPHKSFWIVNAIQVTSGPDVLDQIRRRKEVREIQADTVFTIPDPEPAAEVTPIQGVEWNIDRINAPQVWSSFGVRGEGIVVANIDTGVQFDHPALVAQYRGNRGAGRFDHSYNWFDPSSACANPAEAPCDNNGHGTHTMGTMIGDDGGANQIGVAPRAQWIAAKGCETNDCSAAALTASAQWILAPTDLNGGNPRPDLRPHVVNSSWGGQGGNMFYQEFVRAWVAAGIFPAFSNGNAGPDCGTTGSPGDYPESYSSGAFDANNVIARFSGRGPSRFEGVVKPNIAAPGVSVRSSTPTDSYASKSGTSMASPHTAATVALMWSASPALLGQIAETRALLDQSASDTSDLQCGGVAASNNVWGEGALDALAAVQRSPREPAGALQGTSTDAASGLSVSGTVVEAAGPITRTTRTDDTGAYRFPVLSAGSYNITARAFGYSSQTASVFVADGGTAVRDFRLASTPRYGLDGHVRDGTGTPVAGAAVTLVGTPIPSATTDALGYYGFAGVPPGTYDVRARPGGGCLAAGTRQLILNGDATGFDISLPDRSDAFGYTCRHEAPAYIEAGTPLGVDFDTTRKVVNLPFAFTYYGHTYQSAAVCAYGSLSFVGGCDLQLCEYPVPLPSVESPDGTIFPFWEYLTVPKDSVRSEVLGSAPDRRFVVEWRNVGVRGISVAIDFEVILHENGTIETQYRNVGDDPQEKGSCATIGIEDPSGTTALMYSFHQPSIAMPQHAVVYRPPPSPAVEGTITDANDGAPIAGATVRAMKAGTPVVTLTTDTNGVYFTQLPRGEYTVEVSKARYGSRSTVVSLVEDRTYTQDFALETPLAEDNPTALDFVVPQGDRRTGTLALRNGGGLDLAWMMSEIGTSQQTPGTILKTWTPTVWPNGVGYDGDVWLADITGNRNTEFTVDGAPTGASWPANFGGAWPGDMAYDAGRGWMCQVNGTTDGIYGIYCWDPASGSLTGSITGSFPWARSWQKGLAYRPDDDSFYVDSPIEQILYHVAGFSHAAPGAVIGQCVTPNLEFPGLGWNPAFGTVWGTTVASTINALDPETCALEETLTTPGSGCCVYGLETDEAGNLWIGHSHTNPRVSLLASGLPSSTNVPWLSESVASGTLAPAATQSIEVTADAAGLAPGTYASELVIRTNSARLRNLRVPVTLVVTSTQQPYLGQPFAVPGLIQAEDFDRGGEGVAYHDNVPGNAGSLYRPDEDVDIIAPYPGGHVVNNFETGEWLEYTISVSQTSTYRLEALASSEFEGSRWHMEIDGVDVTGPVTVPNTGSWRSFQWMGVGGVSLAAGQHILRLHAEQEYFNLDALRIVDAQSPYSGQPFAAPGLIQAEDFDRGGEDVAYHDNVPGNAGGLYRPDEDVDIIAPYADAIVVNNFESGEWLEYTISVSQAGTYRLEALTSSEFERSRWHMEIDGVDVTGPVTVPNTGSWRTFQWMGVGGVSLATGRHVLRLHAEQEYFNLDALRIVQ